jgi:FAD:protein FMN transferase
MAAIEAYCHALTGDAGPARATWTVWGLPASVTVAHPEHLPAARRLVTRQFAAAEAVASRFRPGAEIHRLYRAGGAPITLSPLLAHFVAASLRAARRTGGDVDPTVSAAVTAATSAGPQAGRAWPVLPVCSTRNRVPRPAPGHEQVVLRGRRLQTPAGTTLDLTATATAHACDLAAAAVLERHGGGVLVQLGGDVASAGVAPDGGWLVPVTGRDGAVHDHVRLPAGLALATSGSSPRATRPLGAHLIDPHTGMPLPPSDEQVSVQAASCLDASADATASLIRSARTRTDHPSTGNPGTDHVPGPRLASKRRMTF